MVALWESQLGGHSEEMSRQGTGRVPGPSGRAWACCPSHRTAATVSSRDEG